jgi:hypothetical protein
VKPSRLVDVCRLLSWYNSAGAGTMHPRRAVSSCLPDVVIGRGDAERR